MTAKTKPAPGRKTKATIKPEEVGEDLSLWERLRLLYHGRSLMAHRFRYGPLALCGLQRHETDAVHCKACGTVLSIPDEGHD
jgi:hypothetical protein